MVRPGPGVPVHADSHRVPGGRQPGTARVPVPVGLRVYRRVTGSALEGRGAAAGPGSGTREDTGEAEDSEERILTCALPPPPPPPPLFIPRREDGAVMPAPAAGLRSDRRGAGGDLVVGLGGHRLAVLET